APNFFTSDENLFPPSDVDQQGAGVGLDYGAVKALTVTSQLQAHLVAHLHLVDVEFGVEFGTVEGGHGFLSGVRRGAVSPCPVNTYCTTQKGGGKAATCTNTPGGVSTRPEPHAGLAPRLD